MVPWASKHPKQHLDRFSRISRAHGCVQQTDTHTHARTQTTHTRNISNNREDFHGNLQTCIKYSTNKYQNQYVGLHRVLKKQVGLSVLHMQAHNRNTSSPTWKCSYVQLKYRNQCTAWNQPLYLIHLLAPCTPGRSFRSQDKHLLLSLAVEASVMQYLQYGINFLLKFAIARRLPLFRGTLRHIIFPVPSLRPASRHTPQIQPPPRLTMRAL